MITTIILRETTKTHLHRQPPPFSLLAARFMGGGPRTFPGGLNKWQWKRLHEKKAREKEKRLLDQEKQLYQARLRSQIRASVSGQPDQQPNGPLSPKDHIKALADRFVKPGAEDLWNDDDGPVQSGTQPGPNRSSGVPFRSFCANIQQKRGFCLVNMLQKRWYGSSNVKRKKGFYNRKSGSISSDDDGEEHGGVIGNARWPKFEVEKDEEEEVEGGKRGAMKGVRGFLGNATLGKYDVKVTKRRIVKDWEEGGDFVGTIEEIRNEVMERKREEEIRAMSDQVDEFVGSGKRFEDCGISPLTVKALTSAGYVMMSRVQEDILSVCLEGKDALVKARSGSGKVAAFLVPAIETALKALKSGKPKRVPPISVLILCPTRELASQIVAEASVLLKYHDGLGIQMLVGGSRFKDDQKRLESDPCQILVATPGRLLDHVETRSGLSARLTGLKMLILDEVDQLLNLGFRKDVEKIVDSLPRRQQSILFSATVPREVRRVSQLVLKKDHTFLNTLDAGSPDSNSKVKQSYIIAPHDVHFQVVYQILKDHIDGFPDYKVIVFCTTGVVTSLMYLLLHEMRLNVMELHSRKSQLYRSRIVEEFKQSKRTILISSDVLASGITFPDVTLVLQIGIPPDREHYIHRIGRTGREGKGGESVLLLAPWEMHFLVDIKDLPVEMSSTPHVDQDTKSKIEDAIAKIDVNVKEAAYHGWLCYYNSLREIGRDKTSLVKLANQFSEAMGLAEPPAIYRKTAVNMGLKGIPGMRIRNN